MPRRLNLVLCNLNKVAETEVVTMMSIPDPTIRTRST
jgi:hypothetical protein